MWIRKLTKELPSPLAMMICPCGKRLDACNVKEVMSAVSKRCGGG